MSIQAMNEVRRRTIPGGQKAKHVLLHLADYANADWTCWPSNQRISAETQIPIRTLARVMAQLRHDGLISATRRQEGQTRFSDLITINFSAIEAMPLAGVDGPEHATLAHADVAPSDSEHAISDVENMPFRADSTAHSSIKNHHKNPHVPSDQNVTAVTGSSKPSKPDRYDDPDFVFFWSIYPRKDEKHPAWTKWLAIRKSVPADTIIEGCQRYARSIEANKTDRQFVKLAATWLNKRCWEDEHFISPPGTGQPTIGQTIDSLSAALSIVNTRTA